ncbi:unnamed protein product [Dovyalis caffra]|uniref:Uncharacterized protein n=1 Tax=Dovyalis caffra TaxID=77055 RepID=A0AAV1RZ54_9ROSI|nr:unnamed protein product [Dovyalis caffra]
MATEDSSIRSLEYTPTWALATWLKRNRRIALSDAVDKLKSANLADSMLPCRKDVASKLTAVQNYGNFASNFVGNLPLENGLRGDILWRRDRRLLADDEEGAISDDPCSSKGKVSLISEDGIQQLHKFIFVLAVIQIVYSILTMALGWTKMKRWKAWEKETRTTEYEVANGSFVNQERQQFQFPKIYTAILRGRFQGCCQRQVVDSLTN